MSSQRCRTALAATIMTGVLVGMGADAIANEVARGRVFEDLNNNGLFDEGEPGIAGVAVSNGRDVVLTDDEGRYELPVGDDTIVFVTKPRGFAVPLDENNLPQFYYIHKPEGSPDYYYPGVEPTGPLPESIDFALTRVEESNRFTVIAIADPQPRTYQELVYYEDRVLSELVGTDARFAIVLGDIMYDHLNLFDWYKGKVGAVGIPFYHVIGNHDLNFDAPDHRTAGETYQSHFGPENYSFQSGDVHFVAMNSIKWHGREQRGYHTALDEDQLEWLTNDLAHVDPDMAVVIAMHTPLYNLRSGRRMPGLDTVLELVRDRPAVLSINGHTHVVIRHTFTAEDGWEGEGHFEEVNAVTASGAWWSGPTDPFGIPISIQNDGTPPGYTLIDFDGPSFLVRYKAAGYPADHQMRIFAPNEYTTGEDPSRTLLANIYYAPKDSVVEYRLNGGEWRPMEYRRQHDPLARWIYDTPAKQGQPWLRAVEAWHMWEATVEDEMPRRRANRWEVRATLPDGQVLTGGRIFSPQ